ncbi:MAG TPA: prolyl oligopeptidase family serine peptidase [Alphaproteobacteria bacterium]|nr:prolyl oligopeptidase family serine peptidase [Alphaproteobacteria bacterium]
MTAAPKKKPASAQKKTSAHPLLWPAAVLIGAGMIAAAIVFAPQRASAPVAVPAPKAAAPAVYTNDIPRTTAPMGDLTELFEHRIFSVKDENGNGHDLNYYFYAPEKPYPPGLKFPLVMVLHGAPGNAYAAQALAANAAMRIKYPAFIVVPVLPTNKTWSFPQSFPEDVPLKAYFMNKEQDLPDAVAVIRNLSAQYPVDTDRVYAIGCSEGGTGVYGALRDHPDVFAAGVVISGLWTQADAPQLTRRPLTIMHGALETEAPVQLARAMAQQIKARGGKVQYVEMPETGHECPSMIYYSATTWNWLFMHKKPAAR